MASRAAKLAVYPAEAFTEAEATAKIGATVRLLANHNNLSKGAVGHVVDFHETSKDLFEVVIRWDSPTSLESFHERISKRKYHLFISDESVVRDL